MAPNSSDVRNIRLLFNEKGIEMRLLLCLLLCGIVSADEKFGLKAPAGWGGETIPLPTGFAPKMKLKGTEHIRFAPGMMKAGSETFFCYAFAFEFQRDLNVTDKVLQEELLKYYRGLSKAVLRDQTPVLPFERFTVKLTQVEPKEKLKNMPQQWTAELKWVEPFATRKTQTLHMEIRVWKGNQKQFLFACVSPQSRKADVWKQLRKIRTDYIKSKGATAN